jgi:hypothetical protein
VNRGVGKNDAALPGSMYACDCACFSSNDLVQLLPLTPSAWDVKRSAPGGPTTEVSPEAKSPDPVEVKTDGESILALYNSASLSVKEWHDLTLQMVGRCETPEDAQRLHAQFEFAEIAARMADDAALETNFREGKLRLKIFLGLWSRGLEKKERARTDLADTDVQQLKTTQIAERGINGRTARRYEELIGPPGEQAQEIAAEAHELYLAQQREKKEPGTMKGLSQAVKGAVVSALGPPPRKPRSKPQELSPEDKANRKWIAWMREVNQLQPELAADGECQEFAQEELDRRERAVAVIRRYQSQMRRKFRVTTPIL